MENKIWCISDTHGKHGYLKIPEVDIVIFAGDESNYRNPVMNNNECLDFIEWFSSLNIKHKIMIAGNHSSAIESRLVTKDFINSKNIIYLEHEYVEIENHLIFGSPYTPTFGNWCFMKSRSSINRVWENLLEGIDILVTHGPPKGILDLAYNQENKLEYCGDNSLLKKIRDIKPKVHIFGHIHNNENCINSGIFETEGIKFINASVVKDGEFYNGPINNGYIINL